MNERYDENNNCIYYKSSNGFEYWWKYYEDNNWVYFKTSFGYEMWYNYNEFGNRIEITKREFENIKIKEYNSRTKCSRFELMEI